MITMQCYVLVYLETYLPYLLKEMPFKVYLNCPCAFYSIKKKG